MPETIGQRLKQAREYRNLTLQKVTEATRIRMAFLQALEADDYSAMTSAAQARGFLRNYAQFLGLDLDGALAELQQSPVVAPAEISGPLERIDLARSVVEAEPAPRASGQPPESRAASLGGGHKSPPPSEPDAEEAAVPATAKGKKPGLFGLLSRWRPASAGQASGAGVDAAPAATAQTDEGGRDAEPRPLPSTIEDAVAKPGGADGAPEEPISSRTASKLNAREALLTALARLGSAIKIRMGRPSKGEPASDESEPESPAAFEGAEAAPAQPLERFADIVLEIGEQLRKRRELLGLSPIDIENHIHVRATILKALEEGAFDKLPSTVQLRGMLVNYASFLDLEVDRLMLRFADALQARRREKYPQRPRPTGPISKSPSMPPLRAFVAPDLLFGIGLTAALLALGIWGAGRLLDPPAALPEVEFTAPSISEVLAGTSLPGLAPALTATPAETSPSPAAEGGLGAALGIPTLSGAANVRVDVVAVERTFMRVSVDGKETFNGRVLPGTLYPFEAEDQVEILTGNAAALRLTFNGRELGLMGTVGQVVSTIYTSSGIATATATLAPSPTPTSRFTPTPPPSSTPTATVAAPVSAP
jgi:cytoskeletal protein RodZ